MASNKPFVVNIEKINKFVNGDLGIADNIHKVQVTPMLEKAQTANDRAMFEKLQTPNKKTGMWAVEKTFITTALENYKPLIELAKVSLEMFGHLEYTIKLLTGGSNPLNDQNSFIGAFNKNSEEQSKLKTGYEPKPVPPEPTPPVAPNSIFLGKFRRDGATGNVYAIGSEGAHSGRGYNSNDAKFVWPQYKDFTAYKNEELAKITPKIIALDEETKKMVLDGRKSSFSDEWSEMNDDKWMGGSNKDKKINIDKSLLPNNLKYYYKPLELDYLGNKVTVDIEDNYKIQIDKNSWTDDGGYHETFLVIANFDPETGSNGGAPKTSGNKPSTLTAKLIKAVKYFVKKTLDVIIKKFIPVISALKTLLKNPVEFVGKILLEKMKEHFELLDTSLKGKDKYDKDRMKYWTFDDKFVMDGKNVMDVGIFKITIETKDGIPNFKVGSENLPKGTKENPMIKQITNMAAMPLNVLKGIVEVFTKLLKKLFKVQELPSTISDFLSFKDIKDLLKPEKLFEFLGAKNGDVKTIPMLNIPTDGNLNVLPAVIKAFLKMIIQFINGFLGIPNAIFNLELVPQIPVPE